MHPEQLVLITANEAMAAISVPTAPPLLVDAMFTVHASNPFSGGTQVAV